MLSLAQSYYTTGLGETGGSASVTFASVCATVATGGYVNPFAHIQNLHPERIDMGVDYSGTGTIVAIGDGQIISIHNAGWPNGTFIEEKLTSGRDAGKDWFYAEDITPAVQVSQTVTAGEPLGRCSKAAAESRPAGRPETAARPSPRASGKSRAPATRADGPPQPGRQPAGCCNHSELHPE